MSWKSFSFILRVPRWCSPTLTLFEVPGFVRVQLLHGEERDMTRFEKVTFPGSQGASLAGRLELPEDEPRAFALFAHCLTCTKDIFAAGRIAEGLARHGIAVLRFDFTGLGASGGDFAHTNFTSNVGDLVKAADFLRDRYMAPKILIGHSLGG